MASAPLTRSLFLRSRFCSRSLRRQPVSFRVSAPRGYNPAQPCVTNDRSPYIVSGGTRPAHCPGCALSTRKRGNGVDSHVHSHKILSAPTRTMSASNCSDGLDSRPQLFTKPLVSTFIGESRMPCHEIGKRLDLNRGFHDAYTSHHRSDLCQSARHCEN